jgi:hypothetical protein
MDKELLISISRPQKLCMNCNGPLEAIERHPSILKTVNKKGIERYDYCPDCWRQMKDEAYESFWITKRVIKRKVRKLSRRERSTALRALFESLWERREAEEVGPHLFFLAHLLLKWGGLRWKENRQGEGGREIVVFEDPATGDQLEVPAVEVEETRMSAIRGEVEEFLKQYASDDEATVV